MAMLQRSKETEAKPKKKETGVRKIQRALVAARPFRELA
jgi:hypothetical protein